MDKEIYEKIKDDLPEQLREDIEEYLKLDNFEFEALIFEKRSQCRKITEKKIPGRFTIL